MADVLSTLQEASFRGIAFPTISISESGSQDMPQHKSSDRDGAFVEGTGRNPFVYRLNIPCIGGSLARGKTETWDDLYPGTFQRLRTAYMNRETGPFVHPLYGEIQAKAVEWSAVMNADERGGQFVELTLIETRDDGTTPAFATSERAFARSSAADLDAQLATLSPAPVLFETVDEAQSFLELVDSVSNAANSITIHVDQKLAKVDRAIMKLDNLADTIDRAATVLQTDSTTNTVTTIGPLGAGAARIWTNTQGLKDSLRSIRARLTGTTSPKTLRTHVVRVPTMLVALAVQLGSTPSDLLGLNPGLSRVRPFVAPSTMIRYYG